MAFHGMDTEQVRSEAEALDRAAMRLEEMMSTLHASVSGTEWTGADADAFRDRWDAARSEGESIAVPNLAERSRVLLENADEQDRASDPAEGGLVQDVLDWLGDGWGGIADGIRGGVDWLGDGWDGLIGGARDGLEWLGDQAREGLDRFGDRMREGRDALGTAIEAIRDLEWPRWTEVVVDGATLLMRGANGLIEGLTGIDLHLADDGTGYASPPVAVDPDATSMVPPGDLAAIIANTQDTYGTEEQGQVSMTVVGGEQPSGVIVNIPGTTYWWPDAGDNPFDLTGNAAQAGSQGSSAGAEATADAIAQLYADHGIPPDTPLMLNGHSQGGMVATSLAANPDFASQYNVTNVMTYGSPVDNYDVPGSVNQLNIQHASDLVPVIDAEGGYVNPAAPLIPAPNVPELLANQNIGAGSTTTVTLPDPGGDPLDVGGNHSGSTYQVSVEQQLRNEHSLLSQYSGHESLQPFLDGDPEQVQHFVAGVHRRH